MKKKANLMRNCLGLLLAFILVAIMGIACITFNTSSIALAVDDASVEQLCKTYTDSDLIYGSQRSIRDYPTQLYASKVSASADSIIISGDDPIINIIPRQYFKEIGEHFYIGKEYGFYVNTQAEKRNGLNKISVVLVFDIVTNNDLIKNNDRLIVRVEPIFEYIFAYVDSRSTILYYDFEDALYTYYEGASQEGNVIPLTNGNGDFVQYNKYYLKDISFGATLYNEQEVNASSAAYQPEKDDGAFIIMYDYAYKGVKRTAEGVNPSSLGIASLSTSAISSIFGVVGIFLASTNPLTAPLGIISTIFGLSGTILSAIDVGVQANPEPADMEITNGKVTATCKYTTRRDQLAHYVDEKTKLPMLTKAASIIIDGDDEQGNLWYNVGSYAEGYFTISDSADTDPWYTRYIRELALSVVDENGRECVKNQVRSDEYMLRNPIYKETEVEQTKAVSFMPKGNNFFSFTPQYTSDYEIKLDKSYDYKMTVTDVASNSTKTINPQNGKFIYRFIGGRAYKLQIYSPLGDVVNMTISPSDKLTSQSITAKQSHILAYKCDADKLVTVSTSNSNVVIEKILQKGVNGGIAAMPQAANFKVSSSVETYMKAGQTYYFVLRNNSTSAQNATISVNTFTREIKQGGTSSYSLSANDNFRYFKFVPTADGNYDFTFVNNFGQDYIISFYCFDANHQKIQFSQYCDGYLILNGLKANTPYYIAVISTASMTVKPLITKTQSEFVWKYLDGNVWKEITNGKVTLKRGKNYEFCLWVNGIKVQNYAVEIAEVCENYFTQLAGKRCGVSIHSNALDKAYIYIFGKSGTTENLNYGVKIEVNTEFDKDQLKVSSVNYNNTTVVNIVKPSDVISWEATISGKSSDGKSFSYQYTKKTDKQIDIYSILKTKYALGNVTFKIDRALVSSVANGGSRTIDVGNTYTLSATFSKKETVNGKTVYHIANELQFYNIRYDQSAARIFDNDITLTKLNDKYWEPISTLNCDIDGNYKLLKNFHIQVETNDYKSDKYGLAAVNNATISNLTLEACFVALGYEHPSTWTYGGSFAGINNGTIKRCFAYGEVLAYRDLQSVGGIAGVNKGSILNCEFGKIGKARSRVLGWGDVGGIAGQSYGTIMDSRVLNTDVDQRLYGSSRCLGGIVGYGENCSIIRCAVEHSSVKNVNEEEVKSLYPKMGVIFGHMKNGVITSVGQNEVKTDCGKLHKNNRTHCFRGPWPFFGLMENCTVDGNVGQYGP